MVLGHGGFAAGSNYVPPIWGGLPGPPDRQPGDVPANLLVVLEAVRRRFESAAGRDIMERELGGSQPH